MNTDENFVISITLKTTDKYFISKKIYYHFVAKC